jgi:hypothetical protein
MEPIQMEPARLKAVRLEGQGRGDRLGLAPAPFCLGSERPSRGFPPEAFSGGKPGENGIKMDATAPVPGALAEGPGGLYALRVSPV